MSHDSDAVSRTDTECCRGWIRSLAEGLQGLFLLVDASGVLVEGVVHSVLQKRLCAMEPVAGVQLGQVLPRLAKVLDQGLTICRNTGYLQKNEHLIEEADGTTFVKCYIVKLKHNRFSVIVIDSHHERSLALQVAALEADQRQTIQLLHELDARYRTLFDSLNEGVVFVARDGRVLAANEAAAQIFRTTPSEFQKLQVDGRPLPFQIIGEDLQPLPLEQWPMSLTLSSGLPQRESVVGVVFPSSGPFWLALNARPLWRSGESVPYAVVVSFFDITLRKQLEQELHHQAFHDALTSLPNRSLFMDRLDTAIRQARRAGDLVAVFFVDLNGFKSINDELGHDIGDQFLQCVARRLSDSLRDGDTVARFGGDEFTVLLPSLQGAEDALRVAERVLDDLQQPMVLSGMTLTAGASVGISLYPHDGSDSAMLIRHADQAMYRVKAQGRNGCEFFSDEMSVRSGRPQRSDSESSREAVTGPLGQPWDGARGFWRGPSDSE